MMKIDYFILFLFLSFLAEILGTVGGIGSSMLFVPLASFFLDFHSALGVTAVFHVASNITKISFFRKGFDKNLILRIGIPSVIFVTLGSYLSQLFAGKFLLSVLSISSILLSILLLKNKIPNIRPNTKNAVIGGGLSGFLAGLIGTGAAIRGLTLSTYRLSKEVFISTSAAIDLGVDIMRSIVYWRNGYVHLHDLYILPFLFILSILGTYLGQKILSIVSEDFFRRFVLWLIIIVSFSTMFKSWV
ncbi:MAG: sulfite exporter TauE/SafE family protein [Flavobacteriales bacterium]|nr:sulfite exporter TauE/SafE family protein [Flavobacteriales bacterium]